MRKKIQSRAGFEMRYWRISDGYIRMDHKIMDITLIPYVSNESGRPNWNQLGILIKN